MSGTESEEDVVALDEGEPSAKKLKLTKSCVHREFVRAGEGKSATSKCRQCGKVYNTKNPTSLWNHLREKHKVIYKQCEEDDENSRKELATKKASDLKKGLHVSSKTGPGVKTLSQAIFGSKKKAALAGPLGKHLETAAQSKPEPVPKWKQEQCDKRLYMWLGSSTVPISTVEDPEFRAYLNELNSGVKVPGRKKALLGVNKLSKEVMDIITEALGGARRVSATVDIWSSAKCKNSYIGVTVHLFNFKTMKRERYRIACRKFDVTHSGANIAAELDKIFGEVGIRGKVFYVLSDNGSNMIKGLTLMGEQEEEVKEAEKDENGEWEDFEEETPLVENDDEEEPLSDDEDKEAEEVDTFADQMQAKEDDQDKGFKEIGLMRIPCFPHTLQLPILKTVKVKKNAFGKVLKKGRRLVVKYRRSSKAKNVLQKTKFKKRLLGYCKTRWWTDQDMMERLLEAIQTEDESPPLTYLVEEMDWPHTLIISDSDSRYIKSFLEVTELLKDKSDMLGAEEVSTIHLVYPSLLEIFAHLDAKSKGVAKIFASTLKTNISKYFQFVTHPSEPKFDPIYMVSTYLSPIYQKVLTPTQDTIAEQHILHLLKSENDNEVLEEPADKDQEDNTEKPAVVIPGLKFLSSTILEKEDSTARDVESKLKKDFLLYSSKSEGVLDKLKKSASTKEEGKEKTKAPADPMDFWAKEHRRKEFLTKLPALALDIMAIPASSVPSERLFNISGMLSSGKPVTKCLNQRPNTKLLGQNL